MAKATGYAALAALTTFTAKKWFTKSFVSLVEDISRLYGDRNEVLTAGLVFTDGGTQNATTGQINWTTADVMLDGYLDNISAGSTVDLIGGATGEVLQAIMSDGSLEAINLGTDASARISLIAINSNGSGAVSNTAFKLLAVIAGTGTSPAAGAYLSTAEINAALAASAGNGSSGDHSGGASANCSWCHVARLRLDQAGGGDWGEILDNRNNVLGV